MLSQAVYWLEFPEQLISGDVHELKLLGQRLGQLRSEIVP